MLPNARENFVSQDNMKDLRDAAKAIADLATGLVAKPSVSYNEFLNIKGNRVLYNKDFTLAASETKTVYQILRGERVVFKELRVFSEREAELTIFIAGVNVFHEPFENTIILGDFIKDVEFPPNTRIDIVVENLDSSNTSRTSVNASFHAIQDSETNKYKAYV